MRARIGVGELLRAAIHGYEGMPITRAALQLAFLCLRDPGGEFDLEQGGGADCLDSLRTGADHQRRNDATSGRQSAYPNDESRRVKVANLAEELVVMQTVILSLIETHPDHQRLLTVFNAMSANLQLKGIQDGKGRLDPEPLRKVLARFQDQIARKRR